MRTLRGSKINGCFADGDRHGLHTRDRKRFWFEFDEATLHDPNFMNVVFSAGAAGAQNDYKSTRGQGTYPAAFRQKFSPRRTDWVRIADLQRSMIGNILGANWADIQ